MPLVSARIVARGYVANVLLNLQTVLLAKERVRNKLNSSIPYFTKVNWRINEHPHRILVLR